MKTLAEILDEKCQESKPLMLSNRKIIELMQFVREETLKECAEKAEVLLPKHGGNVDKNSILSLDKNSLDV